MIDKERVLIKIDEMMGYLEELRRINPNSIKDYINLIEKRRACERLLQITIECIIDICTIIVKDLKLGIPEDETGMFDKIRKKGIISEKTKNNLDNMKGFRNILVHKYGDVQDELVFENLNKLSDFIKFKDEIIRFLKKK
ncbi:DUF86 domain-containing protein [Candidatus Woesearchaeota archaeon]|nr:DUF86 domain-containing protein [Candidatus Woesearchaeota archaeon]